MREAESFILKTSYEFINNDIGTLDTLNQRG